MLLIRCVVAVLVAGFMSAVPAHAYKLSPEGSFIEKKLANRSQSYWERLMSWSALRGVQKVGSPVHEELTNRMLGCEGDKDICSAPEYDPAHAYFLAGVRWNDDPPFRFEAGHGSFRGCEPGKTVRLVNFPECWARVFKDAEARAARGRAIGQRDPMLVRSHFGDLQFLHSMASQKGEPASVTRQKILVWAEFAWRTALGEFPNSRLVKEIPIAGFEAFFGRSGWSVQDLFALGNPHVRKPEAMSQLVFGSLLHVVQDSFAGGHAERAAPDGSTKCVGTKSEHLAPGAIVEFHAYGDQDAAKHGEDDSRHAFSAHWSYHKPSVIDVGRILYSYYSARAAWTDVKPYVECIFTLHRNARPASAGEKYAR